MVKYFEFRAGIGPLPGVGFIGDLWISWDSRDPSVWFKVEERNWEKWGGCASSVREVSLLFFLFPFFSVGRPLKKIIFPPLFVLCIPNSMRNVFFFFAEKKNHTADKCHSSISG